MNPTTTFKKLPSVLSFKRGHVVSDALMFNRMTDRETAIKIIRHGIRGTQNVHGENEKSVSNIQITETAKLDPEASEMIVRFNLAFLSIKETLHACCGKNKEESLSIRESINNFLDRALHSEGLREVANRYSRNIANGRWLWRNRTIASAIHINVLSGYRNNNISLASFDALKIPSNKFDNYSAEEIKLGEEIAKQMCGNSFKSLTVEAIVTLRVQGSEVFPSQNYIQDKPTGFARPLYKIGNPEPANGKGIRVMGQAAIRDQKIFNAIRTIDTWYPDFKEEGFPIPIEPKGANLEMQEFYRKKGGSFELFKRLNLIDPNTEEGMYCIASFDRGGVYGEPERKDKPTTSHTYGEK